ncbi:MAG: GvpL/GvpF family gas vesicle protein [Chloroflexi bacterium]|nr:GvpL/GvpF family gas vesicle protein [Chloroflexota bacterium]
MSYERKYIYGIIMESDPRGFSLRGMMDANVFTINHNELAAVVSDIEVEEVDPTRANVRAHTLVQDELLSTYTILPMAFGMVASSPRDVLYLMQKNYQGLVSELKRLHHKVEVALKVFWDQESMVREFQNSNEELSRLRASISAATSPIEVQRLLMQAGKMVERIAMEWKSKYADHVYAALKDRSVDSRLNNPIGVRNILNASFLLEKASEGDFRQEVYRLDSQYQGKVNFKYVGPLAPYNFVSLKLEPVE